ncbi:MAG: VWA domain-containing protein [Chloroflexota bacterium]|nr:MAG: VWA domain-containing protein [Chloroflexota bacterium]
MSFKRLVLVMLLAVAALSGCDQDGNGSTGGIPANAIQISIVYSPEFAPFMPALMDQFNSAYAEGRNPVTGAALASGEKPIYITGKDGSSGTVMQGIVNAIIAPNNQNVERPTIFSPSVSHWLALANFQSGRQLFDLADTQATALAPVVMAIWESRLNAIRQMVGYDDVGWEELLQVLNSPNGWQDFGLPNARRQVYYGHTDPYVSSTALSTLIAEFYASARSNGFTGRVLTLDEVRDEDVQEGVRNIEQLIRHYSRRTTEFKEYIAQGTEYLDFVALEENDLIYINQGKTSLKPPERLVALYPKEGTFWHEHPMGIVNADWVTAEQREAARVFVDFMLTEPVQELVMENGFRPANPAVELAFPFVPENGIDVDGPPEVLNVPDPEVVAEIQQSWSFVKKQADVLLVIDVSGSMDGDKITQARTAAEAFINALEVDNRVGLAVFSDDYREVIPMNRLESNLNQILPAVRNVRANGGTELYLAVQRAVEQMSAVDDANRIRAVVVLSDGQDTGTQGVTLADATRAIGATREDVNPVIVIPVAYGSDADINALNAIARASATRVASGDPSNIGAVLDIISSYF